MTKTPSLQQEQLYGSVTQAVALSGEHKLLSSVLDLGYIPSSLMCPLLADAEYSTASVRQLSSSLECTVIGPHLIVVGSHSPEGQVQQMVSTGLSLQVPLFHPLPPGFTRSLWAED